VTDATFRIAELLIGGHTCGNVLMQLALDAQGREAPDLVRAMSGLANGMGQGFNCGALSAGCCVIGYYAGRGTDTESLHPAFGAMLDDFSGWFNTAMTGDYGGIDCAAIMQFDEGLKQRRCPVLIAASWEKIRETLEAHGVDITAEAPATAGDAP